MSDLLPCPFCGGKAEHGNDGGGGSFVQCSRCRASTALHYDRCENLVSSWNERMGDAARTVSLKSLTRLWTEQMPESTPTLAEQIAAVDRASMVWHWRDPHGEEYRRLQTARDTLRQHERAVAVVERVRKIFSRREGAFGTALHHNLLSPHWIVEDLRPLLAAYDAATTTDTTGTP